MDCFDSDVLIYAATPDHDLGARVAALFRAAVGGPAGAGSVLLIPEVLAKPLRSGDDGEVRELTALLGLLDLWPVDAGTASLATSLGARHGLRAADAVHLATAVIIGADRFITNNRRDFTEAITEVDVVYPADLPAGGDPVGQST